MLFGLQGEVRLTVAPLVANGAPCLIARHRLVPLVHSLVAQRAGVQALARELAPKRVNGVIGDGLDATDEVTDWLAQADGVTGQLLAVEPA